MQVGYEKIAILDDYMVHHCWTVVCYQHFDGAVQVTACVCRPSHATKLQTNDAKLHSSESCL